MGQIVNTVLLEKGLRADFMKAYNNGENPAEVMPVIMQATSTSSSEKFGWLGNVPQLQEWLDERKAQGLNDFDYSIVNKDYEATLKVARNEIMDDQLGGVKIRINDLASKARLFVRKLFFDAIEAGTTDLCYDGQAFFSNSHSEGASGTQDNLGSGTGTSVAQISADINTAIAAMMNFKDDQGEPFNEGAMDLYIVAPWQLKVNLDQVLNATQISATDNMLKGVAKPIYSSRLSDANDWYLLNAAGLVKPFIFQVRQAPVFASLEGNSDAGFMRKDYFYGIDVRYGFGYGLWQKAYKVVNS